MKFKKKGVIYYFSYFFAATAEALIYFFRFVKLKQGEYFLAGIIIKYFGNILEIRKEYDPRRRRTIKKAILAIPSYGCAHYFNCGGCKMCGFNKVIEKHRFRGFHPKAIIGLIEICLLYLEKEIIKRSLEIDVLSVFMAGSFINEEELPIKGQEKIIEYVAKKNKLILFIETRAEYVIKYRKKIKQFKEKLGENRLEIAIGLESSDDKIRQEYINKALSKTVYEKAIKILNDMDAATVTYLLIGSPHKTKKEIIIKSIESILYAWGAGSKLVYLEVYCVQEGTEWAQLYRSGKINMLDLWDIINIIKAINKISSNWVLGKFSDWPEPIAAPKNCPFCDEVIKSVLEDIRMSGNIKALDSLTTCVCENQIKEAILCKII